MENQEKIYQNFVKRVPMLNYSSFNAAYKDMCDNQDVTMIHLDACAMFVDGEGTKNVSQWVPTELMPHVHTDRDLWTVTLSITPSAVRYLTVNTCIEFECRLQGRPVVVQVPFTALLTMRGMAGRGHVVDVQDFHCLVDTTDSVPEADTKPKRPTLQVVK